MKGTEEMKKILWIILLILVIVGIVLGIIFIKPKTNENQNTEAFNEHSSTEGVENSTDKEYKKVELDDGVLYTLTGEKEKADIVVGDNYFDTTITDMFMNYDKYKDKKIEIEGIYFINEIFTFVGRYSKSNLCPYCPEGYSYLEYQFYINLSNFKLKKTKSDIILHLLL